MSETYSNEMRFALFKNDKDGNDKRPDYRGTMQMGGVEYELSAWMRTSQAGAKYMSGQVQPKRERANPDKAAQGFAKAKEAAGATETDDVPF